MSELNQFAISRALGSTMSAGETPRFGRLGLLPLVARVRRPAAPAITPGCLDARHDEEIIEAFTVVAEGKARDRLLADFTLARKFLRKAKELGVDEPPAHINRRLMRIGKMGGRLPKATRNDPLPSIDARNAFAIEYGVVRLALLYGATVDDILCEPSLGREYRSIVDALAPGYPSLVHRLGALYLRKTRNLKSARKSAIKGLDPREIEDSWIDLGSVNNVTVSALSKVGRGILQLDEPNRSLYVSKTNSVPELASTFLDPHVWDVVGNHFWHPNTRHISLKVLPASELGKHIADWELRLIESLEPVFNMKVARDAA